MEKEKYLHDAVKRIVDTYGKELYDDHRMINYISDYYNYDPPALQNVMRTIIDEGYAGKMLSASRMGDWRFFVTQSSSKIAKNFGFVPVYVKYCFECLAYGLGLVRSVERQLVESVEKSVDEISENIITAPQTQQPEPQTNKTQLQQNKRQQPSQNNQSIKPGNFNPQTIPPRRSPQPQTQYKPQSHPQQVPLPPQWGSSPRQQRPPQSYRQTSSKTVPPYSTTRSNKSNSNKSKNGCADRATWLYTIVIMVLYFLARCS